MLYILVFPTGNYFFDEKKIFDQNFNLTKLEWKPKFLFLNPST